MAVLRRVLTSACAVTLLLGVASTTPATAATSTGASESVVAGSVLPADDVGETVVDAAHGHVLITTPSAGTITVTDLDGTLVRRVTGLPGVARLLLTADATSVLAAVPGADMVVRLRADDLQEQSRTATGSDTCPTGLAQAAGRLWLSYGCGFWRSGSGATGGAVAPITLTPAVTLPAVQPYDDPPLLSSSSAFPDDLIVAGTSNNTASVEVRDVSGATPYVEARRQRSFLREMHISPDGRQLVTADSGPYVDTYALPYLDVVRSKEKGCTFALAPGGRQTALGTCGGFDRLVAVPTGSPYPTHGLALRGRQNGLAYSADGTLYAVGEAVYGQTPVSTPTSGTTLFVVRGWQHDPLDLQVRADREQLRAGEPVHLSGRVQSTDGTAPGTAALVLTRSGPDGTVALSQVPQDSTGGFTASDTPPRAGGYTYRVRANADAVHAGALAEVEVQVGEQTGTRPVYPAQQGQLETTVLPVSGVTDLVIDDLHRQLFVSGNEKPVQVLDFDGHVMSQLPVVGRPVSLSRDSTTLLVATPGAGELKVIDTATLQLVTTWPAGYRNDRVATAGGVQGQLVLGADTGQPYQEDGCITFPLGRPNHVDPVARCGGGSGTTSAAAPATLWSSNAGDLQRFDAGDGRLRLAADLGRDNVDPGLADEYARFTLSHDGRRLVHGSSGLDTAYLVGEDHDDPSAVYPGDRYVGESAAFSPDDRYVASVVPQTQPDPPHENHLALSAAGSPTPLWVGLGLDTLSDGPSFSADGSRLFALTYRRSTTGEDVSQVQVLHDPLGGLDGRAVAPGPARDVTVNSGAASTTVTWSVPWHDGGNSITGYTVTAQPSGAHVEVGPDARSAVLPVTVTLQPQTVGVVPHNQAGDGPAALAKAPTTELAAAPGAVRTSRDPDGAVHVVWHHVTGPDLRVPATGPRVTGYLLRASPGGLTYRVDEQDGSPQIVPAGLRPGVAHTFTVAATTARGDGLASPPSPPVTVSSAPAATAPSAPRAVRAVSAAGAADVGWAEAGNNGSALTRYTITASPGGRTATTTGATQVRVTGLTPGTAYRFTVTATNAVGTGPSSAASNAVVAGEFHDQLAASGTDEKLYVRDVAAGTWRGLGGVLSDAPAVVRAGTQTYYLAVGSDRNVLIRTASSDYRPFARTATSCRGLSAAVDAASTLYVACRGPQDRLSVARTSLRALPVGALPQTDRFRDLGGLLGYGTATTATPGGGARLHVVGTDHRAYVIDADGTTGSFLRELTAADYCYSALAYDPSGRSGSCLSEKGALQVLDAASPTPRLKNVGGLAAGSQGVVRDPDGSARYYLMGTNGVVYGAWQGPSGDVSGFRRIGGTIEYGVAAAGS